MGREDQNGFNNEGFTPDDGHRRVDVELNDIKPDTNGKANGVGAAEYGPPQQ